MIDTELPIAVGTLADWDGIQALLHTAFHGVPDAAMTEAERGVFEPDRSLLVRDGEAVVGHAAAFTRELTVPGAVRIVDVPAALAARRYAAGIDVVLEVTDPLLPDNAGRWQLTAGSGTARCTRTDAPAELACDVRDLGAAYLGGPSFGTLAAAGRVRELLAGALARASAAFGWHRAPAATEVF